MIWDSLTGESAILSMMDSELAYISKAELCLFCWDEMVVRKLGGIFRGVLMASKCIKYFLESEPAFWGPLNCWLFYSAYFIIILHNVIS